MRGVAAVSRPQHDERSGGALIQLVPTSAPDDHATEDLVGESRGQAPVLKNETGAEVAVTGNTAVNIDVSDRLGASLLPFIAIVVCLCLARPSVIGGARSASRVVTAAALIMFSVFASFVITDDAIVKPIAFSLAFGVLVDAFLIRMTLVPAVLAVVGCGAWWLPGWLDRLLPNLDIEGACRGKWSTPRHRVTSGHPPAMDAEAA